MKPHLVISIFVILFSVSSFSGPPSLQPQCDIAQFSFGRMHSEHELLNTLEEKTKYASELTDQLLSCYQKYYDHDLEKCDFNDLGHMEGQRLWGKGSNREWDFWQVSEPEIESIQNKRFEYWNQIAFRINRCFEPENLRTATATTFEKLWWTIGMLSGPPAFLLPSGILITYPSTLTKRRCHGRDGCDDDDNEGIHLNVHTLKLIGRSVSLVE